MVAKGQAKLVDANQRMVFSNQLKWWCWSPTTALSPYETEKWFGVKSLSFPTANLPQLFRSAAAADGRYCWRHTTSRTPLLCLDVIAISIAGRGMWLAPICVLVGWQKSDYNKKILELTHKRVCRLCSEISTWIHLIIWRYIGTCTSRTGQTLVRWKTWARCFAINGV